MQSVWISYEDRSPVERVSGQPLVPALEFADGGVVFDSMQIVRVLEERFPSPPLYPAGAAERARLIHFVHWFDDVWKSRRTRSRPRSLDSYQRLGDDHPRLRAWIERVGERPRV